MAETVRLIHQNGSAVTVAAAKVDRLLVWGFALPAPAVKPKPAARRTRKR